MPDHDSRARTTATDLLADAWINDRWGRTPGGRENGELLREAYAAGLVAESSASRRMLALVGNSIGLLTEAMQRFRFYEAQHRAKVDGVFAKSKASGDDPLAKARADTIAKAKANAEIAARIEAFLMHDSTPKDRVYGLALSLVQDLVDMTELPVSSISAEDWDSWEEALGQELWGSLTRLRAALEERVGTPGHSDLVGVTLPAEHMEPMCPTPSKPPVMNVCGYCRANVPGDMDAMRQHVWLMHNGNARRDPPPAGYVGDGKTGVIVNDRIVTHPVDAMLQLGAVMTPEAEAAARALCDEPVSSHAGVGRIIDGPNYADRLYHSPDDSHDSGEFPKPPCVQPPERTVAGLFPGDPGYPKGGEVG